VFLILCSSLAEDPVFSIWVSVLEVCSSSSEISSSSFFSESKSVNIVDSVFCVCLVEETSFSSFDFLEGASSNSILFFEIVEKISWRRFSSFSLDFPCVANSVSIFLRTLCVSSKELSCFVDSVCGCWDSISSFFDIVEFKSISAEILPFDWVSTSKLFSLFEEWVLSTWLSNSIFFWDSVDSSSVSSFCFEVVEGIFDSVFLLYTVVLVFFVSTSFFVSVEFISCDSLAFVLCSMDSNTEFSIFEEFIETFFTFESVFCARIFGSSILESFFNLDTVEEISSCFFVDDIESFFISWDVLLEDFWSVKTSSWFLNVFSDASFISSCSFTDLEVFSIFIESFVLDLIGSSILEISLLFFFVSSMSIDDFEDFFWESAINWDCLFSWIPLIKSSTLGHSHLLSLFVI